MSKKHMPLYIGGGVVMLLALALGFGVFRTLGAYSEKMNELDSAHRQLERLTSRSPFPSDANVQIAGQQLGIYQDYLNGLFTAMSEGQAPAAEVDQDHFRRILEANLRKLVNDARAKSVTIPVQFPFGFHRYVAGTPAADKELPRLVSQLQSVSELCGILYDAGISELTGVERTVFEKDAQLAATPEEDTASMRRSRRRGAEEEEVTVDTTALFTDSDGLFTKEHYVLMYKARDEANWKVLDRLAAGVPFTVVTKMEIVNAGRPLVAPPASAVAPAGGAPAPVSATAWQSPGTRGGPAAGKEEPVILQRDLRVVAGREIPDVRLEVDVYRFTETPVAQEGEEQS